MKNWYTNYAQDFISGTVCVQINYVIKIFNRTLFPTHTQAFKFLKRPMNMVIMNAKERREDHTAEPERIEMLKMQNEIRWVESENQSARSHRAE